MGRYIVLRDQMRALFGQTRAQTRQCQPPRQVETKKSTTNQRLDQRNEMCLGGPNCVLVQARELLHDAVLLGKRGRDSLKNVEQLNNRPQATHKQHTTADT